MSKPCTSKAGEPFGVHPYQGIRRAWRPWSSIPWSWRVNSWTFRMHWLLPHAVHDEGHTIHGRVYWTSHE